MKNRLPLFALALAALPLWPITALAQTYSGYNGPIYGLSLDFTDTNIGFLSGTFTFIPNVGTLSETLTVDSTNQTLTESGTWTLPAFSFSETFGAQQSAFPHPLIAEETLTITLSSPVNEPFNSGPLPLTNIGGSTFASAPWAMGPVPISLAFQLSIHTDSDNVTHNDATVNQSIPFYFGQNTTINTTNYPSSIDPVSLGASFGSYQPTTVVQFASYTAPNGFNSTSPTLTVPEPDASLLTSSAGFLLFCSRRSRRRLYL
jgi:hypothetical protein